MVIGIISLLVAILLPDLTQAKELAKRAACAGNINALGKAMRLYAAVLNGRLAS